MIAQIPASEVLKKIVPLDRIIEDHSIQIRGGIDSDTVKRYEEIVREHGGMNPIDLFYEGELADDTKFLAADGFHRLAAYRACSLGRIKAFVHQGDRSAAIELALKRNGGHGRQMNNEEKRHATEVAVMDTRIGAYPDAKIAKMIGVSASLVSLVRRGVSSNGKRGKKENPEPAFTIGGEGDPEEAATPKKSRQTGASGKRESESTAPRSASARERKDTEADKRPTKAVILKQIETYLNTDCVDENDLIHLLRSSVGQWVFLPKDGAAISLKVVGTSGRSQVEIPVTVKEINYEQIKLCYSAGKLQEA